MNTSCMSCVYDMSRTHDFTHVVRRVGTRYADVRWEWSQPKPRTTRAPVFTSLVLLVTPRVFSAR